MDFILNSNVSDWEKQYRIQLPIITMVNSRLWWFSFIFGYIFSYIDKRFVKSISNFKWIHSHFPIIIFYTSLLQFDGIVYVGIVLQRR